MQKLVICEENRGLSLRSMRMGHGACGATVPLPNKFAERDKREFVEVPAARQDGRLGRRGPGLPTMCCCVSTVL